MTWLFVFVACSIWFWVGYRAGARHQARVDEQRVTRRQW